MGGSVVGSDHLLLGLLLLGSGVHFAVLRRAGFDADGLRAELRPLFPFSGSQRELAGVRFDPSAVAALERAEDEAGAQSHGFCGTEHILLGLLAEENGSCADILRRHSVDTAALRTAVLVEMKPG